MLIALAALAVVGAFVAGIYLSTVHSGATVPKDALQTATIYPDDFRRPAGFKLLDHHGETFDNQRLRGRWNLLFFGFTYCPDVCPMTLRVLDEINAQLAGTAAGNNLQIVFVSVDPERDSPERLREYVEYFNPGFLGVTGEHDQLQALTRSLGAFYSKANEAAEGKDYLVDHTASLFLLSPEGRVRALFSTPLKAGPIAGDIATIHQYED